MKITALIILLTLSTLAHADRAEYCHGFTEGYKSIKGGLTLVPLCPINPITPINSTDFREGIKDGAARAKRDSRNRFSQFDNGPGSKYVRRS